MRASEYYEIEDPVQEFVSQYCYETPLEHEKLSELSWYSDDDEILCYQSLEDNLGIDFTDHQLEMMFEGELKLAHLIKACNTLEKNALITTPEQRAKMKEYRMKNKATLARKARRRRNRQKSGLQRKSKRMGAGATGYTFVQESVVGKSGSGTGTSKTSFNSPGRPSFNPSAIGSTERSTKLKGM